MPRPLYSHVLNLRKELPGIGTISSNMLSKGATITAITSVTDSSNVTIGGTPTFIHELSLAVDPGRPLVLWLRCAIAASRTTVGGSGTGMGAQAYSGGTSGNADGTLTANETIASIALTQNLQQTIWYPLLQVTTPAASPFLWKFFLSNGDTANYAMVKFFISMFMIEFS